MKLFRLFFLTILALVTIQIYANNSDRFNGSTYPYPEFAVGQVLPAAVIPEPESYRFLDCLDDFCLQPLSWCCLESLSCCLSSCLLIFGKQNYSHRPKNLQE